MKTRTAAKIARPMTARFTRCDLRSSIVPPPDSLGEELVRPLDELDENRRVGERGVLSHEVRVEDSPSPRARASDVDRDAESNRCAKSLCQRVAMQERKRRLGRVIGTPRALHQYFGHGLLHNQRFPLRSMNWLISRA